MSARLYVEKLAQEPWDRRLARPWDLRLGELAEAGVELGGDQGVPKGEGRSIGGHLPAEGRTGGGKPGAPGAPGQPTTASRAKPSPEIRRLAARLKHLDGVWPVGYVRLVVEKDVKRIAKAAGMSQRQVLQTARAIAHGRRQPAPVPVSRPSSRTPEAAATVRRMSISARGLRPASQAAAVWDRSWVAAGGDPSLAPSFVATQWNEDEFGGGHTVGDIFKRVRAGGGSKAEKQYVRWQRDFTQEVLRPGPEHITLYRGVGQREAAKTGTRARVDRLASFTENKKTATAFATEKGGAVFQVRIPRQAVFSNYRTGPGTARELEWVVMPGTYRVLKRDDLELNDDAVDAVVDLDSTDFEQWLHTARPDEDELCEVPIELGREPNAPRDDSGRFEPTGGGGRQTATRSPRQPVQFERTRLGQQALIPGVRPKGPRPIEARRAKLGRLTKAPGPAFTGTPVRVRRSLDKLATGVTVGERVAASYLAGQGISPDRILTLNVRGNNFPVDLVAGTFAVEVKAGLVSNSGRAQQWRTTIGEPGVKEKRWLARASDAQKARYNETKQKMIIARKQQAMQRLETQTGLALKPLTIGLIINPDTRTADIYRFEGFHARIGWTSAEAERGYVGSVRYAL